MENFFTVNYKFNFSIFGISTIFRSFMQVFALFATIPQKSLLLTYSDIEFSRLMEFAVDGALVAIVEPGGFSYESRGLVLRTSIFRWCKIHVA